jgi:hypothetical protein
VPPSAALDKGGISGYIPPISGNLGQIPQINGNFALPTLPQINGNFALPTLPLGPTIGQQILYDASHPND